MLDKNKEEKISLLPNVQWSRTKHWKLCEMFQANQTERV